MFDITSPAIYIPAIFLALVFALALLIAKDARFSREYPMEELPYYDEINLSIGYIKRNILENGRFKYRKNVDSSIKYDNKIYNSLRHAGILYSLYMYEKCGYKEDCKDYRLKTTEYFINRYVKKLGESRYVVVSIPKEEQINMPIAKSGATGIALCALANLLPEKRISADILRGLGDFLLYMQAPDGRVYAYFDLEAGKINKDAEAIFYTSEAAFGLLHLYEVDNQMKWLHAAKKAIFYVVKNAKEFDKDAPFDHWAILTIEKLLQKNWLLEDEKNILIAYVERILIATISNQITDKDNSYFGAFYENIRPGSIGTIMEGLAASYNCTDNEDFKELIYKSLSIGCLFLNKVQVKTGAQAGGVPNSANWVRAGVSPNASVIRMDNVQHVILAWLKFQQIIKSRPIITQE